MSWTDIPNASLEPGAPARSIDAIALRDNIAHVRDGNNLLQLFTVSGTYTKPSGLKRVKVTVVGGGGGAGNIIGGTIDTAWPGAGGGASIKVIEATALGATETVTVGAGGAGGSGSVAQSGTAGGTSSFGAHCSATGGAGGLASNADPAADGPAGGVGSGGNLNFAGGSPSAPYSSGSTYPSMYPDRGGESIFGPGAQSHIEVGGTGTNGNNAVNYGSGGGTPQENGVTDYAGGSGKAGIVIVEEFY